MKIVRCISWIAVSSEEQARPGKTSLDDQRRSNLDFIHSIPQRYPGYRGMLVTELEIQGSRRIIELEEARKAHEAYDSLYDAIKGRTFDVLVCPRWDRLGREESLLITIRDLCIAHDIAVAVTSSPPPVLDAKELHNDEGWRIAGTVQAWGSGREDREISRRVRTGRRDSVLVNKNFLMIGYGYKYEFDSEGNRSVVLDKSAAAVIRRILVTMYLEQGMGRPAIAKQLNQEGILTPNGYQWQSSTVERLVTRRWILAGYMEFGRFCDQPLARVKGTHAPIITEEELQRLEVEVARRRPGPPRTYALSGTVWCTTCDRAMAADMRRSNRDNRTEYKYLRCRTCNHSIRESYALEELRLFIEHLQTIEDFSQFITDTEYSAARNEITHRLAQIDDQLAQIDKAIERLLDAYEFGSIPQDRVADRINTRQQERKVLLNEQANLQLQLTALQQAGPPLTRAEEVRSDGLDILNRIEDDPGTARLWLRDHVRILAADGEITDIILV